MKLVLAIEYYSLKPLAFRFTLPSVTKISSLGVVLIGIANSFLWVSGIKEAYKGLLNGDILVGIEIIVFYIGLYSYGNQEEKRI